METDLTSRIGRGAREPYRCSPAESRRYDALVELGPVPRALEPVLADPDPRVAAAARTLREAITSFRAAVAEADR